MACHRGLTTDKPNEQRLAALPASERIEPNAPVYRLADFIFFRHRQHAGRDIRCATCHGDVWTQDLVKPVLQMKMKACVDCHQANRATVACTACHELSQ